MSVCSETSDAAMQFPIFTTLRDSLGLTAAETLTEIFGGKEIIVPRRLNPRDALTVLIGVPAATVLIQRWGGKVLRLPPVDWRPGAIAQLKADGSSNARIAALVGLSERQVYRVRRTLRDRLSTPAPAQAAAGVGR